MLPTSYEAEIRVRVKLDAANEAEAQQILAHHIHRMVKFREAESTEVFPIGIRELTLETRPDESLH
ncbi:MAG TPA: hypothetical protein V6D05_07285 [Stenomitos sp.]